MSVASNINKEFLDSYSQKYEKYFCDTLREMVFSKAPNCEIAKWAHNEYLSGNYFYKSKELLSFMLDLTMMELGEEYMYTRNELLERANKIQFMGPVG